MTKKIILDCDPGHDDAVARSTSKSMANSHLA